jgi:hypothetical protein
VEAQFNVRILASKRTDARQQPDLQERRQQADLQRAGAAVMPHLLQGRFELLQSRSHRGQQFQALVGDFDTAPVAAK